MTWPARHAAAPSDLERYNANLVGGDISGGVMTWRQLFARPVSWWQPYALPLPGHFLCSASTPPGTGVHGMCGYFAAEAALQIGTHPEEIGAGLRQLSQMSDEDRKSMGDRARALVATKFSWSRIGVQMRSVYEWLLKGGTPPDSVKL